MGREGIQDAAAKRIFIALSRLLGGRWCGVQATPGRRFGVVRLGLPDENAARGRAFARYVRQVDELLTPHGDTRLQVVA